MHRARPQGALGRALGSHLLRGVYTQGNVATLDASWGPYARHPDHVCTGRSSSIVYVQLARALLILGGPDDEVSLLAH